MNAATPKPRDYSNAEIAQIFSRDPGEMFRDPAKARAWLRLVKLVAPSKKPTR